MADVFISYHVTPGTTALVRDIADELESIGVTCWYAPRNVKPGAFVPSILEAIDACKVFLLILDEGANGPGYVYNETLEAFNRYKSEKQPRIIPFKLGTFPVMRELYFYLRSFHVFEGGASAETADTAKLIREICGLFDKAPAQQRNRELRPAPTATQPPPQPAPPTAAAIIARGKCGDNVTYTLDENGLLTISGNGSMRDYDTNVDTGVVNTPWWDEHKTIRRLNIQGGVTTIGRCAFRECAKLTGVTIPHSVTTIGEYAFGVCAGLKSVTIPDSVTTIRQGTFEDCKALKSVTIPDSVTTIGDWAFAGCAGLTSVTIPDSVTKIGNEAFIGCAGLTSVTIPGSVKTIGGWAFKGCAALTNIRILDGVTEIGEDAFEDCVVLKNVTIPDSVTEIGEDAFAGCKSLKSVSVPVRTKISHGLFFASKAFPANVRVTRRE